MKVFYGLTDNPFALTPDPRFISWSPTHREAFQHLLTYHESRVQVIVLTGDRGTGKTTLLQALRADIQTHALQTPLSLLPPSIARVQDLYACMASDLGLASRGSDTQASLAALNACFMQHMQAHGRIVLLLDAAHEVPDPILEEIGLMASIGSPSHKLFHIVLAGHPSLPARLAAPQFAPIKARVSVVCHLSPLSQPDTHAYITRRLAVAGRPEQVLFHPDAIAEIHRCSRGIPRLINMICSHALLHGFLMHSTLINADIVRHTVTMLGFPGACDVPTEPHEAHIPSPLLKRHTPPHSDAHGVRALPPQPRRSARSTTRHLSVALLSLGVTLLVTAGTFMMSENPWSAPGARLRVWAPPARDRHPPAALQSVSELGPLPQGHPAPATAAGQPARAAPGPAPVPTPALRLAVAPPPAPQTPFEGGVAAPPRTRQLLPPRVPEVTPVTPVATLPGAHNALGQANSKQLDRLSKTIAASIRQRMGQATACHGTPSPTASQGPPAPGCAPQGP
jgi:general secretion pathway protein A